MAWCRVKDWSSHFSIVLDLGKVPYCASKIAILWAEKGIFRKMSFQVLEGTYSEILGGCRGLLDVSVGLCVIT